jgi:prepilin-type N-terminal cleavage/methylation domain-containing protein
MVERTRNMAAGTARGFSLVELMITVLLLSVIVVTLTTVMRLASHSKTATTNGIEATEAGRVAVDMLARDLRSAGYGADRDHVSGAQPPIAYVDSLQVLINANFDPWPDTLLVRRGSPQAYEPSGTGRPRPLIGTEWTPPAKYTTGAEIVRWTLDLDNDGAVGPADQVHADAVDAARTPNPADYELVRQVFGDSTGNSLGNNGPVTQRVALVRRPGSGVAPLFTVYMQGSATPWDWSNGPVPAAQLRNIERVAVEITAPSGKRDWRGRYAESRFKTEVNSMRNVPQTNATEYAVDGYVYLDSIVVNRSRDVGERGLAGATMHCGMYSTVTSASGYFCFHLPAGTYWLKQVIPPDGYVNTSVPESLSITVPPATTRHFPDAKLPGGTVSVFVFEDLDNDGVQDAGEPGRSAVRVALRPAGKTAYTGPTGYVTPPMFSPVGTCSVTVTAPDSFVVTTTNPVVLSVADGGGYSATFGVFKPEAGTISGRVFRDTDRDGVLDAAEAGIQNVWVGVTTDGGLTVPGYAWTDANGAYSLTVPANDPPGTTPYSVMIIPPAGYFPTTSTAINGVLLSVGETIAGQNFGLSSFTVITLDANRVLSLGSADMIEKDWNGNQTQNRRGDVDIVLGSDTGGSDQISTWFNRWDSTPLFNAAPDYTRSAPGAVLSMALDWLNVDSPLNRPDLVTGCKVASAGNFFLWYCQNSSGNEGYYAASYSQAYKTSDQGDVQAVLTLDCAGGAGADRPDVIVGTKSPTAFSGTIELWTNDNAATPALSRTETYPGLGGLAAGSLGEVTAMVLGDFDGDALRDLAVGTRTALGGQVYFLKNMGKTASPHFTYQGLVTLDGEAVTSLTATDVNGDGRLDVVAGTHNSANNGRLLWLRNGTGAFDFDLARAVTAPGIVTALASADLGGGATSDLVVGFRVGTSGYVGGVRIYYLDAGTIPHLGVDPSADALVNWVPAVTTNNFNYGTNPAAVAPFLQDLAAGVKVSASTGAVVVFVR